MKMVFRLPIPRSILTLGFERTVLPEDCYCQCEVGEPEPPVPPSYCVRSGICEQLMSNVLIVTHDGPFPSPMEFIWNGTGYQCPVDHPFGPDDQLNTNQWYISKTVFGFGTFIFSITDITPEPEEILEEILHVGDNSCGDLPASDPIEITFPYQEITFTATWVVSEACEDMDLPTVTGEGDCAGEVAENWRIYLENVTYDFGDCEDCDFFSYINNVWPMTWAENCRWVGNQFSWCEYTNLHWELSYTGSGAFLELMSGSTSLVTYSLVGFDLLDINEMIKTSNAMLNCTFPSTVLVEPF